jgi:hypothetical protein
MFYVNNDDMEELFRQAAERYPLKTDGEADWELMSAALREKAETALADAGNFKKEKKRRVFLWWILLLPLGWIGHDSWQKLNAPADKKITETHQVQSPSTKEPVVEHASEKTTSKPLAQTDFTKIVAATAFNKKTNKSEATQNGFNISNEANLKNNKLSKEKNIAIAGTTKNSSNKNSNTFSHKNAIVNDKTIATNKNESINNLADNDKDKTTAATTDNNITKNNDDVLKVQKDNSPDVTGKINDDAKSKTGKLPEPSAKKDDKPLTATTDNSTKKAKATVALQKNFHFYAGLMVGADFSTIKFQSVKGMGNSFGLLLGYHISHSKFNIETGFYLDIKKYYTDGEYFNKKNVPYFNNNPNVNINYVSGTCNMYEIPVNVRYNIAQTKNTSFFAVLGLSSYLMHEENYNYELSTTGGSAWPSNVSYYHSTKNWFSIMNLSVGYEHRLGKIGDIRIEPYAKLPLSGVGKGNLAITSGGLNVGISRRF